MATPEAPAARGAALPYLRAWREYRLLSMEALGKMATVSPATLSKAELHGRKVRYHTIRKLSAALRVDPETLVRQAPPTQYERNEKAPDA